MFFNAVISSLYCPKKAPTAQLGLLSFMENIKKITLVFIYINASKAINAVNVIKATTARIR